MAPTTHPLQFAPWTSDIELAFYSALASIKINHDKLDSSARKVLGVYEINHKDTPERSMRMQIHGGALTSDETSRGFYRGEGLIRNFNTLEEFRQVDKAAHIERAGRMVWEAINDGTIYSCPSLLSSFSAVCFADLKKYRFTYHFAYPAIHSDPPWKLVAPGEKLEEGIIRLGEKETETLVDTVQTWRYGVDTRQHGFFLAKRLRKAFLEAEWKMGRGEIEEEEEDGNLFTPKVRKMSRSQSLGELGFLWSTASLASYETGFFGNAEEADRFVCFADPSTYASHPGWMLRNLLVLVRQRWHLDKVQILCYRDTHLRRDHPASLIMNLQSATPVFATRKQQIPIMTSSSALGPDDVNASGELIERKVEPSVASKPEVPPPKIADLPKVTGWERNDQSKLVSRTVDLASYLDPTRLADQAVDLNLKLIKWRISPSINLETIKHTSCLLLGAGTLGAYVARNLMGWGVRKISFVDNARISYSNPVRQPLYEFKDCQDGGARKAERAAQALQQIYPGVDASGHYMSVPMAGHPIMDEERVKNDFEKLQDLIQSHDAVFLLMDTRESRWLPTVMAKAAGKIVINAALGFDTYMVMRHGVRPVDPAAVSSHAQKPSGLVTTHAADEANPLKAAASDPLELPTTNGQIARDAPSSSISAIQSDQAELGCYFCSDVVAPADSLKSATLDQQCTVTRPGAAPIASALAVELLVSITQHRLRARAPAPPSLPSVNQLSTPPPTDPALPHSHPLGTVPHQLRGYMSTWQTLQVHGPAFDSCAACSEKIVRAYETDGWAFVRRAIGEKGFVEEVSGLAEIQRRAEEAERAMMEADDDEDWDEEGEGEML